MDPTKKRKLDGNGAALAVPDSSNQLTPQDSRKIVEHLTPDQLLDVLSAALTHHPDVLDAVRSIADADPTQRKLFIRGLGWDTTAESLHGIFSAYGELEEAVVILDKVTGKSKGYGFIMFKHIDGAMVALKEPSKKIDGRVTVTNLAVAGNSSNSASNPVDVSLKKIFVGNVPNDMSADKLLAHFACYGEIEEGPLGFDKQTGKPKGFALFVYKTAEGAQAALVDPIKTVDGKQLNCRLAENKKTKPDGIQAGGPRNVNVNHGDGMGMVPPACGGSMPGSYGGPGGHGLYGPFSGPPPHGHHVNSSLGRPGQVSSSFGGVGAAGCGAELGGPHGGYGGPGSTGYGGLGGGAASGELGGGSSLYRLLPSSVGMPSGGYPDGGHYNLSSASAAYPCQHHQATGTSPVPTVPPGVMYSNLPPYY